MGGHSMLPLELPHIDVPKVSYRIIPPKPLAETDLPLSNSDHSIKHLNNFGYNSSNTCELPTSYIRWVQPAEDERERGCEYDMDEQDLEWLHVLNMDRKRLSQEPVTCELFEIIMDRLEKEWFRLNQSIQKPDVNMITAEDSRCAICEDGDTENSNAIVFCDGCNLAVHQDCYGVPYIPEGQWLCRKCTVSPDRPVACELCPNSFGAFKQTSENKWAHLVCAIHIPETGVGNAMYMEPIDGVRGIPKQRWKLKCYICKKIAGACIQCANRSCCVAYHATCAQETGLYVKMKPPGSLYPTTTSRGTDEPPENSSADHVGNDGIRISQSFCDKHTPKGHIEALRVAAEARLSTHVATIAESNPAVKTADSQPSEAHLAIYSKNINSLDDLRGLKLLATGSQTSKSARAYHQSYSTGPPLVPEMIFQRVMQYSSKLRCAHKKAVVNMICKYWSLKREVRRGAPLLKRLHLEPWTAAGGISSKNEEDRRRKYGLLVAVRDDIQQVKNLAAMICKREKIKIRHAEIQKEVIEKTLFPAYPRMTLALTSLIEIDKQKYFLHPVSATEVPDYYDVIKHPMNWSTIQRKLDRFEYFRLSEFISDIHLTLTNARIYNHASSVYHKAAIRIGLTSESFPTHRQKEHFAEVPLILLPDCIGDLLDVQISPGSPRSYQDVIQERNAKRSTQSQTSSIINLLSSALYSQNQTSSSHNPLFAGIAPSAVSQPVGQILEPNAQSVTSRPRHVPCSPKAQTHRGGEQRRTIASSSNQPLLTASTIAISSTATPPPDKEFILGSNETKNTQKTKRRRTTTDSSASAVGRPVKRPAPRTKPQAQLEEEALIEQQNPNATPYELKSLKRRAYHAKQIEAREVGMSEEQKAKRRHQRDSIRLKRWKEAQAREAQNNNKKSNSERTEPLSSSRAQTNHPSANAASPDLDQACSALNEAKNRVSREVSHTLSTSGESHNNNVNGRTPEALPQLRKVMDDGCESRHGNLPKESTNRASGSPNHEGTVSPPSPSGSGARIEDLNSRMSVTGHEEVLSAIDERSDEIHSLITSTKPIAVGTSMINPGFTVSIASQGDVIPTIGSTAQEVGVLSIPEGDPNMHADTEEFLSAPQSNTCSPDETIDAGLADVRIEASEHTRFGDSTTAQHRCASPQSEATVSHILNQNNGDLDYRQDFSTPVPRAELPSGAIQNHFPQTTASDEEMALEPSLLNGHAELLELPSLSSHLAAERQTVEECQPFASATSLSAQLAQVEQTCPTIMATPSSPQLMPRKEATVLRSTEVDSEASPIQMDQDGPTRLSPQLGCSLVDQTNKRRTRSSPLSPKKTTPAHSEPAVGLITQCSELGPPTAKHYVNGPDKPSNGPAVESRQKLKIRIKKMDLPAPTEKNRLSESLPAELMPLSVSPKLRLILDASPGWGTIHEAGGSINPEPGAFQEDVTRHGREIVKSKPPKSAGHVGPPEFVASLPGERDSFRLFNRGFILPKGTRRRHAASLSNGSDSKTRELSHPQSAERHELSSPRMKLRPTRFSPRLKPVRLTLLHNPSTNQATSTEANASNSMSRSFSADAPDCPYREQASPPTDESESSELSKASSTSPDQANSCEANGNFVDSETSLQVLQEQSLVVNLVDQDPVETPRSVPKANKNFKTTRKSKITRAEQEKELETDSRGFTIYPKAPNNPAKGVHALTRNAFTRMSQTTRLPEEGLIEDGTLVWAKVHGHPWFPAEVGLPEDPGVPKSMLDKKPKDGKMRHYVLVMFFDRQRSWQWVQRRNTRLLGESDELDALLSSDAYVSNKSQLEEIKRGCEFARSNIERPTDNMTHQSEEVPVATQQHDTTSHQEDDFPTSRKEEDAAHHFNNQEESCDKELDPMVDNPIGLKRPRRCRLRASNHSLS
ncbi:hypothetical protein PCASD_08751 [Puccinia coronata f. sp. avenae]|uniref:Histone acetyltransferase n=1 Tax=Puccinia coronata f. sp. avenae TaxID=200324 RepID=A0A2N5TE51_9BASI|nr:hypothetical protein PCASD_08751 [Puccinia coronata f. sp. avenae]